MAKSKLFSSARFGVFAAACFVLVLQASTSRSLKVEEDRIGTPGLHALPWQIESWQASSEDSIGPDVEAVLKPDEYILRDYSNQKGGPGINLFVAYFKSLQNVYGPHSPRICLPASGWLVSSSKITTFAVPGRPDGIPVNQYTMEKGDQKILVLYWYQNDRDVWAEEYHAKLRLLPDLIRYHRSDVSLVRLVISLDDSTTLAKQLANCRQFTQGLFPLLAQHFASVRVKEQS
jgi:EpsI family protein